MAYFDGRFLSDFYENASGFEGIQNGKGFCNIAIGCSGYLGFRYEVPYVKHM